MAHCFMLLWPYLNTEIWEGLLACAKEKKTIKDRIEDIVIGVFELP